MRSKFLSAVLIVAFSAVLSACSSSATSSTYTPGTYTGTGDGAGGDITVKVTVNSDGSLFVASDGVTGEHETIGIGGKEACENGVYAEQINAAQSADVDGVSGATLTSAGVRSAVEDALRQAREAR